MSDSARKRGVTNEQQGYNNSLEADGVMMTTPYANADHKDPSTPAVAESHTRSLVKGLTWRCLATLTTVIIAWMVTGETGMAFQIGFFEFFAKLAIYYIHERVWTRIRI
jgi:uncharacterized membrane protein